MNIPDPVIPVIDKATPGLKIELSSGPARPVVLLPVRLETRFFSRADGDSELRVRVYPDTVHIDSHEPELTDDELTWGKHFWEQTWRAGSEKASDQDVEHEQDQDRAKAAWQQLADRFDAPRAAWIARALQPLNRDDRPARPVAPEEALSRPILFPSPATKKDPWERAPETRVLPSQWIVLGYKDGQLVINLRGNSIADPLVTGPNPDEDTPTDEMGIDEAMKWMVDFKVAEDAGMGVRVTLNKEAANAGLDFLLVMGIKDSPGGTTASTERLAELFNAHHYTDGLSFVSHGTPTNNTQDAPSGFSSQDVGHKESYLAERATPEFLSRDGSNADVLTTALGLGNTDALNKALGLLDTRPIFADLPNATAKEQLDAEHMNTALWEATWGYFLLQMLGVGGANESGLTDKDIAWAREHFIDYVRASGPLPALRVGKQPYGVLPVTSLKAWIPGEKKEFRRESALRDFLVKLRDVWRNNIPETPRLGRNGIDQDIAKVLSMDGLSSNYSIRPFMGRQYMEHLWVFLGADFFLNLTIPPQNRAAFTHAQFRGWFSRQLGLALPVLQTLDVPWFPRLARGVFSPDVAALGGALVQTDPGDLLTPNYIQSLFDARDLEMIRDETGQPPPPRALLYLLLRHSMLLEYIGAGSRILMNRGSLGSGQRREPELVNLKESLLTQTVWERMKTAISIDGGSIPVGEFLFSFREVTESDLRREPELKQIGEFRSSLAHLQSLPPARLEQLLTGTLDLCSHRLDAWITSFATKRLDEMRQKDPTGVLLGAYGWVMNLKPGVPQLEVTPPGEQGPLQELPSNPGFIHTPSLTQAATAAVLRSGHLAHSGNQSADDPFAIDLSSERVRLANWLLDGVRQGQPLGALLGYRFERRLHQAGKAEFISYFRELAPLVARKLEQTTEAVEAIAANHVVDGLALERLWQQARDLLKTVILPPGSAGALSLLFHPLTNKPPDLDLRNARTVLEAELGSLADSVDAVGDALTAESVYQAVRGNALRAASTVESIAGGETPPPELEVVRTPRTGIALTHRLVTLFSGEPTLPPEWTLTSISFRASAEPHLNAWTAKMLGNPRQVRCVVELLESETGTVLDSKEIRLDELRLAPLDFIYAVEGGQGGQQAEIEQRILYTIMRKPDGFPSGSLLRINPSRQAEWAADELSYGEFSELLRVTRKLLTFVRGIDADDLNLPERSAESGVDVKELEQRAGAAQDSLRQVRDALGTQLAQLGLANLEELRKLILRASSFGVAGAVPLSAREDSTADHESLAQVTETLNTQARSILQELEQRVAQLTKLDEEDENPDENSPDGELTPKDKLDRAQARLRILFGKAFVVLPRFKAPNAEELEQALADSVRVQDGEPLASTTWFLRMARVRDGVSRLNDALTYAEALGSGEKLKLTIAQLPFAAGDRWIGLSLKEDRRLRGGRLALVVQSAAPVDVRQALAGVLIDEWVEVVPNATETTGIAFQYDRPNSAPPQTILIAVPPELGVPWTVGSLQQVLLETLDLARIRAVDPDALDEVGHYLPASYLAFNTENDTVSTDFSTIK